MNVLISEIQSPAIWQSLTSPYQIPVFHSSAWLECFRQKNRNPKYFVFTRGEEVVGLIAGLEVKSSHSLLESISRKLYCFSGPVLLPDYDNLADACLQALKAYAAGSGYMHMRLDCYDYQQRPAYAKLGLKLRPREEFIIHLDDEPENLKKRFSRNQKANVRKGYKNNLVFEKQDSFAATCCLDDCLNSTRSKKLRKGYDDFHCYYMKYLSKNVVEKLIHTCATIYHVLKDGEVVSSSLTVTNGKRAYVVLAGTLPKGYKMGAFPFLIWNTMQELAEQGIELINLGGLPTDHSHDGLRRSKTGFGARSQPCAGGTCEFLSNGIKKNLAHLYLTLANRSISVRNQVAF